ncbi:VOC family protein [Flagellimonas allohymeniacidonis]|uniref:VOC domain-containing protein n=1 Tax=Flagellimonas allohymeniacidonis TaxID=2517819 RepID=A0A4Q8QI74_9FLAO|nr:VOC family protein [Allomuricauda hymeniacidonis]TAI49694.1 hypothetical protein EW142_07830 [Allomuricauda hymeniacidonis]
MEKLAPQWIVDNLKETIHFYKENLGFEIDWQGTLFAIISKGDVTLMIRELREGNLKRPNRIPFIESGWHTNGSEAWDAYIWVQNADELYTELKQKEVAIFREIQDSEYGNRDFEIEDNNGYILCFGHKT